MHNKNEPNRGRFQLSLKDHFLLVIMGFSALLAFALSFSLWEPDGRPYLFCGCIAVYLICILIATQRKALALGTLAFVGLRLIWSIAITGAQGLSSLTHH
jgi:hypothetical protein